MAGGGLGRAAVGRRQVVLHNTNLLLVAAAWLEQGVSTRFWIVYEMETRSPGRGIRERRKTGKYLIYVFMRLLEQRGETILCGWNLERIKLHQRHY
jgi:hypothetical protein